MKKGITKTLVCAIMIMIASCSEPNALEKYNCEILDIETMNTIKKTVYIQIPNQLTELELKEIATQLREENSSYERLFIFYFLPDMYGSSGAWATTHYNADLEIIIIGADKSEEEAMKSVDLPDGELIGKWYDKTPYIEHSIIIYKHNGKYKLKETYKDGSLVDKYLEYSESHGKSKFVYENAFGEYLMIENDGRLGQYDNEGFISFIDKME